jgi:hypothetical protein
MRNKGFIIIYELIVIFIFSLVMISVITYAALQLRVQRSTEAREEAFHIAEAGINYYQWRLAHYPTDYQDGTGAAGPYVHDYVDKSTSTVIGRYSLEITPPALGSTIVTISSTGYTLANPNNRRTITTRYGIPSLAQYGFLTNSYVQVGSGSTFYGRFHSNSGIQFNGTATAPVTSARATYACQSGDGCSGTHDGIWGSAGPATQAFWDFPVSSIDFSSITSDLAAIRTNAQASGIYLAASGAQGYSIVFNSNATVTIYRVTSLRSHQTGWDVAGNAHNEDIDYLNRTQIDGNPGVGGVQAFNMPTNGLIFVEDRTWVEGTVDGRAMVAVGRLPYNPATAPSIIIPNNLVYETQDGSDVLGLIGQKDILISYFAPNNLSIHAAFIAQNGAFQRYCYPNTEKDTLTVYGSITSSGRAAIYSTCSGDQSGYPTRNYTYDSNLLYGPPPAYPLSDDGYQQITWSSD